ncbi:MAG: hypothetical protein R2881_03140 [Eubacteriales bacterium]
MSRCTTRCPLDISVVTGHETPNHIPKEITELLARCRQSPQFRITEWELKQRGFDRTHCADGF